MPADNIQRITICLEKDSQLLRTIDEIRGSDMSRSKACRKLIQWNVDEGEQYVMSILEIR